MIKLRATIIVDIDAGDYKEAASIEDKFDAIAQDLAKQFKSEVDVDIRQRRDSKATGAKRGRKPAAA